MDIPFVSEAELSDLLSIESAIDALDDAFGAPSLPVAPARTHLDVGTGDLLLMPAWNDLAVGVKLVTVNPANPPAGLPLINGIYILFSQQTLQPVAAFDAAPLTAIRTAAVSGVATRYLARPEAGTLVMFGAGTQARHHLGAMLAVRPLAEVVCVSRTPGRIEEFLEVASGRGLAASAGTPEDVARADIVCTCTTSPVPVFDGDALPPGVHVNAVGAYKPTTRELDDATLRRGTVVVETRAAALTEAGDLLIPIDNGVIDESAIVAELSDVVRGKKVRRRPEDITIFKSVGAAFEDLVVAGAAYARL
jgi:ornithine cyclodeaminase/alanine dehydrogenase-like protein (mu-crystallin family)